MAFKIDEIHIRTSKILTLVIAFALTFQLFCDIFKFKNHDGAASIGNYYRQPKIADVLVFGSSCAYVNVNTQVLYGDYGIAATVVGASMQPLWSSYYYMREVLKYQKPKLIVLEGWMFTFNDEYNDPGRIIANNYGIRLSVNLWNSMRVSVPEDEFWEYFITYPRYHNRYLSLTKDDFSPYVSGNKNWHGFSPLTRTARYDTPDVAAMTGTAAIHEKTKKYYHKIISLAISEKIPLMIIVAPFHVTVSQQRIFNSAEMIARESQILFINFNTKYDEMGFDFSTDMADNTHLNTSGNIKFTSLLAQYMLDAFSIPDRRHNIAYQSWEADYEVAKMRRTNEALIKTTDLVSYAEQVKSMPSYTFAAVWHDNGWTAFESVRELFGSSKNYELLLGGEKAGRFSETSSPYIQFDSHCFDLSQPGNLIIDGKKVNKRNDGLTLAVYDSLTDSVVDVIGVSADLKINR